MPAWWVARCWPRGPRGLPVGTCPGGPRRVGAVQAARAPVYLSWAPHRGSAVLAAQPGWGHQGYSPAVRPLLPHLPCRGLSPGDPEPSAPSLLGSSSCRGCWGWEWLPPGTKSVLSSSFTGLNIFLSYLLTLSLLVGRI